MLSHWHSHRWIHGDIKPSNLALDEEWRLHLLDLESAVQLEEGEYSCDSGVHTEKYAAPEVLGDRMRVTLTSDLYSAGVIIREVLRVCAVVCPPWGVANSDTCCVPCGRVACCRRRCIRSGTPWRRRCCARIQRAGLVTAACWNVLASPTPHPQGQWRRATPHPHRVRRSLAMSDAGRCCTPLCHRWMTA